MRSTSRSPSRDLVRAVLHRLGDVAASRPPSGGLCPPSRGLCDGVTTMPSASGPLRRRCGAGSRATAPGSGVKRSRLSTSTVTPLAASTSSAVDQAGSDRPWVSGPRKSGPVTPAPARCSQMACVVAGMWPSLKARSSADPRCRGAEGDLLLGHRRVGLLGVVGRDEGGHVDEVRRLRGLARAGAGHRPPACQTSWAEVGEVGGGDRAGAPLGRGGAAGGQDPAGRVPLDLIMTAPPWHLRLGRARRRPAVGRADLRPVRHRPATFDGRIATFWATLVDEDVRGRGAVQRAIETCGSTPPSTASGTATGRSVDRGARPGAPGPDGKAWRLLGVARDRPSCSCPDTVARGARAHGRRVRRGRRRLAGHLPQPQRRGADRGGPEVVGSLLWDAWPVLVGQGPTGWSGPLSRPASRRC